MVAGCGVKGVVMGLFDKGLVGLLLKVSFQAECEVGLLLVVEAGVGGVCK